MKHIEISDIGLGEATSRRDTLRERLKSLNNQGQTILGRAKSEGRGLSPVDEARVNKLSGEFDEAEATIAALDEYIAGAEDMAARGETPGRKVAPTQPGGSAYSHIRSGNPRSCANLFPGAHRDAGPFADFAAFAQAVATRDPRLHDVRNSAGMSEGVGADGGFAVPQQLLFSALDGSLVNEVVRPYATVLPMQSSTMDVPSFDSTNRTLGIGGLLGKTTGEGVTAANQKPIIRTIGLRATKFVILVPATLELMADAPTVFARLLTEHMGKAMAASLNDAFLQGTGVGQPLGLLNAPCKITVAKETTPAQAAATILAPNVARMAGRLMPGSWSSAIWLCSPSALPQLYLMLNKPLNQAASDFVTGVQPGWFNADAQGNMTLMGRPLLVSDSCSQVGTEGDLILFDPTSYYIGLRQDATLAVDYSKGFAESEAYFRLSMRLDGQPSMASAVTPKRGTDTVSTVITLATR